MAHDPVLVTSAGKSGTEERHERMRRYLLTQVVRVVCLVLAVALPGPLWFRLLFVPAALLLPYLGVVAANGAPKRPKVEANAMVERVEPVRLQLEPGSVVDMD